jgi:hypothetical protein
MRVPAITSGLPSPSRSAIAMSCAPASPIVCIGQVVVAGSAPLPRGFWNQTVSSL